MTFPTAEEQVFWHNNTPFCSSEDIKKKISVSPLRSLAASPPHCCLLTDEYLYCSHFNTTQSQLCHFTLLWYSGCECENKVAVLRTLCLEQGNVCVCVLYTISTSCFWFHGLIMWRAPGCMEPVWKQAWLAALAPLPFQYLQKAFVTPFPWCSLHLKVGFTPE